MQSFIFSVFESVSPTILPRMASNYCGLNWIILLPQPPQCWHYSRVPPHLARCSNSLCLTKPLRTRLWNRKGKTCWSESIASTPSWCPSGALLRAKELCHLRHINLIRPFRMAGPSSAPLNTYSSILYSLPPRMLNPNPLAPFSISTVK